ncbi:phytanoyl-CoA dioxygenase [Microbulbifer agarilyticus]|uniref:Phytanoyl-CoA dioxygenase n=1 Tax=Microbulbifer agarilyticus TaxID=260552 RepID=A0A1Q2M860_9GAMM|nr:phytanoyl-CoA dioxygenase family protein [Microbulbifer agarilyticus]AQQ68861.1 phytanoyl-CoA dioxygenase [Microbulbifer agarilyticus]
MDDSYTENGYCVYKNFASDAEIKELRTVVERFHQAWKQENAEFYAEKAINSAYLTGTKYLSEPDRKTLFRFIGSAKLIQLVTSIMGDDVVFLNTQLFFDPVNASQKNYWHRDPQYHLSLEEQQQALHGPEAAHFRIALKDEPGLELIPRSHRHWDSSEELDVRLEQNGRRNYEPLSRGETVPLNAGDLLVFSANMIHRGIYGMDRLGFDILFCEPDPGILRFMEQDCLPDEATLQTLDVPRVFTHGKQH